MQVTYLIAQSTAVGQHIAVLVAAHVFECVVGSGQLRVQRDIHHATRPITARISHVIDQIRNKGSYLYMGSPCACIKCG